jgi:hypothetical protein
VGRPGHDGARLGRSKIRRRPPSSSSFGAKPRPSRVRVRAAASPTGWRSRSRHGLRPRSREPAAALFPRDDDGGDRRRRQLTQHAYRAEALPSKAT